MIFWNKEHTFLADSHNEHSVGIKNTRDFEGFSTKNTRYFEGFGIKYTSLTNTCIKNTVNCHKEHISLGLIRSWLGYG